MPFVNQELMIRRKVDVDSRLHEEPGSVVVDGSQHINFGRICSPDKNIRHGFEVHFQIVMKVQRPRGDPIPYMYGSALSPSSRFAARPLASSASRSLHCHPHCSLAAALLASAT